MFGHVLESRCKECGKLNVYTVRGRKLNRALVERAVSLSDEKYCSATAMIRKSAAVTHEVVLVEV